MMAGVILTRGEAIEDEDGNIVAVAMRNFERTWWEPVDFAFPDGKTPNKTTRATINRELSRRRDEARKSPLRTDWVV